MLAMLPYVWKVLHTPKTYEDSSSLGCLSKVILYILIYTYIYIRIYIYHFLLGNYVYVLVECLQYDIVHSGWRTAMWHHDPSFGFLQPMHFVNSSRILKIGYPRYPKICWFVIVFLRLSYPF
jgi:hypothetical protein